MYPMISSKKTTTNIWLFLGTHKKRHGGNSYLQQKSENKNQTKPIPHPLYCSKTRTCRFSASSRKQRWNPNMEVWKTIFLFKSAMFRCHVGNWNVLSNYAHVFQWNQVVVVESTHCFQTIQYLEHSQDDFSVEVSTGQSVYPLGASFPWPARPMGKQEGNPRIMEI